MCNDRQQKVPATRGNGAAQRKSCPKANAPSPWRASSARDQAFQGRLTCDKPPPFLSSRHPPTTTAAAKAFASAAGIALAAASPPLCRHHRTSPSGSASRSRFASPLAAAHLAHLASAATIASAAFVISLPPLLHRCARQQNVPQIKGVVPMDEAAEVTLTAELARF